MTAGEKQLFGLDRRRRFPFAVAKSENMGGACENILFIAIQWRRMPIIGRIRA